MLVVLHFSVGEAGEAGFRSDAEIALTTLAARPGFRGGRLGRSVDDPKAWVLVTEWDGVGAWRRALSSYDVKMNAVPLLSQAHDQPSAYEVLSLDDGAGVRRSVSDRAADADSAGPIP